MRKEGRRNLKILKGDPRFGAQVGHGGPQFSAPAAAGHLDASVSSFLTIAVLVVAAVKKAASREKK